MVKSAISRRSLLAGIAASALFSRGAMAADYVELTWSDLLPQDAPPSIPDAFSDMVLDHNAPLASQQPQSTGVRTDWNGKSVRMPGYIIPLEFDGSKVTTFILVPFVGACIHVPPPPANQLVYVTAEEAYESSSMFEPVYVTGTFGTATTATPLADIGYEMTAQQIEPYRG